jgi:hypothetical protein
MDEPAEKLAGGPDPVPAPRSNRGWFRRGDRRINRDGRPRKPPPGVHPADCTKRADRVKRLFVRERDLAWRLTKQFAPWVDNLPADFQIIDSRVDAARQGVVFTIRSSAFPRIARGTPIPEFHPSYNGLKWRRW